MSSRKDGPIRTTCPYCGVGCGVLAELKDDGGLELRGDPGHPSNYGRLCSKGAALPETIGLEGRLLYPEIGGHRAAWDEALALVARRFTETIATCGPDSVAFYASGQLLTEDYYVANKLMKGFIGSANIDTNSRLCMASAAAGHMRAFGADTVPGNYEDLEQSDLVVLVGSNLAWCHPVLYQRLMAARLRRTDMKLVVIDPRRTVTADAADLHLPIAADGDIALFVGLLAWLAAHGAINHAYVDAHTTGLGAALAAAGGSDLHATALLTGLSPESLEAFFRLFTATRKVVTVFSQGVNQSSSGTDKVNAIINCHLATGRIGRPGMGPFSVTGQPNAMGGREVGGLANVLAAHMALDDPADRARVQRFWSSPRIADRPGLKAVEMFRAVADGSVKAIWIMATNPVDSLPEGDLVEQALRDCPFVVVSDCSAETDTIRHAHVKLPAAAWGEKDGTVTNSERRVSRQRPFRTAPGEARPDWWIITQVARRMGFAGAFNYRGPAEIFAEHAALSAYENEGTRDFDIGALAALDAATYDRLQPVQWPYPKGAAHSTARFFARGGFYTTDGRARLIPIAPCAIRRSSHSFPLVLNTGRVRDHWHTMTRTGQSPRLSQHLAEPFIEISPDDAEAHGIRDADLVRVSNGKSAILLRALVSARQAPGSVFVPMHWTDQFAANARVDRLVPGLTDPHSGQPASKHVAVRIERFAAASHGFAVLAHRPAHVDAGYWALARCQGGWQIELGFAARPDSWDLFAESLFGAGAAGQGSGIETLGYEDRASGQHRFAAFDGSRLIGALFIAPNPVAVSRSWAAEQLVTRHATGQERLAILAARPNGRRIDRGAVVCSCLGIGVNEIAAAVAAGCHSVEAIGQALQAGTNCGSCRGEIKGIIDAYQRVPAA